MSQYGWVVALDKCIGCESCTIACKTELNTPPTQAPLLLKGDLIPVTVNYREVIFKESGSYPNVAKIFITSSCNHCQSPACVEACPVSPKAITKRSGDGIVIIDQDKCIGCKYCIWACPYGAPRYNSSTQKVEKCTFCLHRVSAGLEPACVTTCPAKALTFTTDFDFSRSGENKPSGFAEPALTKPAVRFENG